MMLNTRFCCESFFFVAFDQTTSRRLADRKVERFEKNITMRGAVRETTAKKGSHHPVGPILLGFFVFVFIGSYLFQIIRSMQKKVGLLSGISFWRPLFLKARRESYSAVVGVYGE